MVHVVRLQNLPNSASAADVRAFFRGYQIPNGGVKIIGGDKGDCFVVFSVYDEASESLRRDGMWLNDQRVSLMPSSSQEMDYVVAVAKGEQPSGSMKQFQVATRVPNEIRQNNRRDDFPMKQGTAPQQNRYNEYDDSLRRSDTRGNPNYPRESSAANRPNEREFSRFSRASDQSMTNTEQPDRIHLQKDTEHQQRNTPYNSTDRPTSGAHNTSQVERHVFRFPRPDSGVRNRFEHTNAVNSENRDTRSSHNDHHSVPRISDMASNFKQSRFDAGSPPHPYSDMQEAPNNQAKANPNGNIRTSQMNNPGMPQMNHPRMPQINDPPVPQINNPRMSQNSNLRMPKFTDPMMPQFNTPRMPQFNDSRMPQLSDSKMPQFNNSRMPQLNDRRMPQFNDPRMPEINDPRMPQFNDPRMPHVSQNFNVRPPQHTNFEMSQNASLRMPHKITSQQQNNNAMLHKNSTMGMPMNSADGTPAANNTSIPSINMMSQPDQPQDATNRNNPVGPSRSGLLSSPNSVENEMKLSEVRPAALLPTPMPPASQADPSHPSFNGPSDMTHSADFSTFGPQNPVATNQDNFSQPSQSHNHFDSRPFHDDLQCHQHGPPPISEPHHESSPIRVTDPCVIMSRLPHDVSFMQVRGLFATHSIIPKDIVFVWPKHENDDTKAFVLFTNVDTAVSALNELPDMKISGQRFDIKPCTLEDFTHAELNKRNKSGYLIGQSSERQSVDRPRQDSGRSRRHGNDSGQERDEIRRRRDSRSPPRTSRRGHSERESPPRYHSERSRSPRQRSERSRSPRQRSERSRSPRPRSERRRRSREREAQRRRSSPERRGEKAVPPQQPEFKTKSEMATEEKSSWCVVLSGLPPKTTAKDVEEYLKDMQYLQESIYLELNVHKECTGSAYVEMSTEESHAKILTSQKELLNQTIQAASVTKDQMKRFVELHKNQLAADKTKPGEFILQLIGLPFEATPRTVKEFLYPAKVRDGDIRIMKKTDGSNRCSGNAFAKVMSIEDRDKALTHDKGYIGKRYVCVKVVSQAFMDNFVAKDESMMSSLANNFNNTDMARIVNMANLRYDVKPEQIEFFFKEFQPELGSVKFIMNKGMPTGRGSIKLKSVDNAQRAIQTLNKRELAGRNIVLSSAAQI